MPMVVTEVRSLYGQVLDVAGYSPEACSDKKFIRISGCFVTWSAPSNGQRLPRQLVNMHTL